MRIFRKKRKDKVRRANNARFIETYVTRHNPAPEDTRPSVIIKTQAQDNENNEKAKLATK